MPRSPSVAPYGILVYGIVAPFFPLLTAWNYPMLTFEAEGLDICVSTEQFQVPLHNAFHKCYVAPLCRNFPSGDVFHFA